MKTQTVKHTPGPWKYRPSYHEGEPYGYVVQWGIKVIADLGSSPENLSIEEANARLIAAAPDLLASLKQLFQMIDDIPDEWLTDECEGFSQSELDQARAAIAKAEGNQ